MRKLLLLSLTAYVFSANAQSVFWTEDFSTGCNRGTSANGFTGSNGTWTVSSTGTNDPEANLWFVSATSAYTGTGNCGGNCTISSTFTDGTLHIGNPAIAFIGLAADSGASYVSGGFCGFGICATTNTRAESPAVNCTGRTGITLMFDYMENGDGSNDDASVYYSPDGGATWSFLVNPGKTSLANCPLGEWTVLSVGLPASADNNSNVKIGFNWTNNDDGTGSDPSVSIDSIRLVGSVMTGIEAAALHDQVNILYSNETIIIDSEQPVKLVAMRNMLGSVVNGDLDGKNLTINAAAGIYLLELEVNGQRFSKKVIKR